MAQADAKEEKDDWATAKLEIPNIAIVPRWGANWEKEENVHWYPGVLKELSSNKNVNIVKIDLAPDINKPTIDACNEAIDKAFKANKIEHSNTLLLGHSVGCNSILRYIEKYGGSNDKDKICSVLLVGAWFTVKRAKHDGIQPWVYKDKNDKNKDAIGTEMDLAKINSNICQNRLYVMTSNDDPVSDYKETRNICKDNISNAVMMEFDKKGHWFDDKQPEIEATIKSIMKGEFDKIKSTIVD